MGNLKIAQIIAVWAYCAKGNADFIRWQSRATKTIWLNRLEVMIRYLLVKEMLTENRGSMAPRTMRYEWNDET